jgi:hypothetical protein
MNWIDLAQDRDQWRVLVNTVMNPQVPQKFGKFFSNCTIGGFSRRAQLHEVSYFAIMIIIIVVHFMKIYRMLRNRATGFKGL